MAALTFTVCSVYLPPHTIVTLEDLWDLLSQLCAPLLLFGDFRAWDHLWGSIDEDKMGQIIETDI
jgi:hypothetical protein